MKYNGKTIFKNKKCKTYYTRFRQNGKQYYISGKTQTEVLNKLKNALNIETKSRQNKNCTTLEKWYNQWLNLYKINIVKESTIKDYEKILKNVDNSVMQKDIKTINLNDIIKNLNSIDKERTKQKLYELLKAMFDKAVKHKLIKENIFDLIEKPKHSKEKGIALNNEQQEILIKSCNKETYGYFIKLILFQGLRIGEALAITGNDIDLTNNKLIINKSINIYGQIDTTKNEQSNRIIPIFKPTQEILQNFKNLKEKRIFNLSYYTARETLKQIINKTNLPNISLHDLRHTFITNCKNENIPEHIIQSWVGHEIGSKVTSQVYTHINSDNNLFINKLNNSKFYSHSTHE